ncbi:hypothetical protein ACFX15_018305 [Malus domestica]
MGSDGQAKLPVVDLTNTENLKPRTEAWRSTCKQVQQAFEDCGCFEATYHGVPLDLHNAKFSASKGYLIFQLKPNARRPVTSLTTAISAKFLPFHFTNPWESITRQLLKKLKISQI